MWVNATQNWLLLFSRPNDPYDANSICGFFGTCNKKILPICRCLHGFEPSSPKDWNLSDWYGRCVRKTSLQCGHGDGFLKMPDMYTPNQNLTVGSAKECESTCIRNYSCSAYSYSDGRSIWSGGLQNLKQLSVGNSNGIVIYIQLTTSDLPTFKGTKRLLVYEYMPFGSLDIHLFGKNSKTLEGKMRYQIALGTARGLAYLHEECRNCIIHCDIKPKNILLELGFCPKVADFGLAKLFGHDFRRVLTIVRRTRGYLAPEWIFCLLDSKLEGNFDEDQVTRACNIAYWCIQEGEMNKPSMRYAVQVLEGVVEVGIPPFPFYLQNLVDNLGHERDDMEYSGESSLVTE
ncbi:hypothetical protein GIB67_041409 [Kingdonia uniflora]|uniref:Uncharacterized protein n=1 Tax=Kingdonia uniflora TaxID=39325 RepID=A0A7J7LRS3_9MAGN|nr:hypothetical protein GIB67_041409 [Kingdonia uniflora]